MIIVINRHARERLFKLPLRNHATRLKPSKKLSFVKPRAAAIFRRNFQSALLLNLSLSGIELMN
jgi:hypothetical protein